MGSCSTCSRCHAAEVQGNLQVAWRCWRIFEGPVRSILSTVVLPYLLRAAVAAAAADDVDGLCTGRALIVPYDLQPADDVCVLSQPKL